MIFSIRKPQKKKKKKKKEINAVEWNRRIREDAPRQTVELMAGFFDLRWASLADFDNDAHSSHRDKNRFVTANCWTGLETEDIVTVSCQV